MEGAERFARFMLNEEDYKPSCGRYLPTVKKLKSSSLKALKRPELTPIEQETRNLKLKLAMTPIDQDPLSFVKRYSSVFTKGSILDMKHPPLA